MNPLEKALNYTDEFPLLGLRKTILLIKGSIEHSCEVILKTSIF